MVSESGEVERGPAISGDDDDVEADSEGEEVREELGSIYCKGSVVYGSLIDRRAVDGGCGQVSMGVIE